MIQFTHGNIFNSTAEAIVNPVNCVGVMGKGLALAYKQKYPYMFTQYQKACFQKDLMPGKLLLINEYDKKIVLFPTKTHWKLASRLEFIKAGLETFAKNYKQMNINSIAFPRIGCGLGGLNWENEVKSLIINTLKDIPIEIFIYE